MNEIKLDELEHKIQMLCIDKKYLEERCEFWKERFEEADAEILKVGVGLFVIGVLVGAVGVSTVLGWLS